MKLRLLLKAVFVFVLIFSEAEAQHIDYRMSLTARRFDYSRYNQVVFEQSFPINKGKRIQKIEQSLWSLAFQETNLQVSSKEKIITIQLTCLSGILNAANLAVEFEFNAWSPENYLLLPAAAYNGNRFESRKLRYSPKLHDIKDIGPDKPIIVSDIPRLNNLPGVSFLQDRSGSMSVPSMGFYDSSLKQSFWFLTTQKNEWGDYGFSIEENRTRNKMHFSISSPLVRQRYAYTIANSTQPSWDKPADFKKGDVVTFQFRVYESPGANLQVLFDQYADLRKKMVPIEKERVFGTPFSVCMKKLESKFNQQNFVKDYGYYSVGMRENFLQDWQIGWTGGMISTLPLLVSGDSITRNNVMRNFDWLFLSGISPSGFFWDAGRKGKEWFGGDIRNKHTGNWHLVRKSGDGVWYVLKQFLLMEKMGLEVKPLWKQQCKKVCDAFVRLWNQQHQFGQFVHAETGEIIVGGSSSGAIVPAALCLAASYYGDSNYLKTAVESGNYFFKEFTSKGITCGGPGDALQNPDSESSEALVESYVQLYESTQDSMWLASASAAAKQFATWVVAYNYTYADTTAFYKAGIKTMGSVYANTQNKHAAPGICTASGLGLLNLYRYTRDPFFLDLIYDIAHPLPQYLPSAEHPIGNAPNDWVSERINLTDWEGEGSIGYVLPISTWAETSLMLTAVELPGIYIDPSAKQVKVFDQIKLIDTIYKEDSVGLTLFNPSNYHATISYFIEKSKDSRMGKWMYGKESIRKIELAPGEKRQFIFDILFSR